MRRILSLIVVLMLVLGLSATVFADIIWIPENLFLNQNMDACERYDRNHRALTEVKVYESPEDATVLWTIPEGEVPNIYYIYEDSQGNLWGLAESMETGDAGWIALAYTELVYDYISFEEEFGHQFETPDDWVYPDESCAGQEIWFWSYPGSESGFTFSVSAENMPALSPLYTDALGRVWGQVGYFMGIRNAWVCITAPTADYDTLYPADTTPEVTVTDPAETEPSLPAEEIVPQISRKTREVYIIIGIGVAGCVAVSALLLRAKKRSK